MTSTTIEVVPTTVYKYKKEVCFGLVFGLMSANIWCMLILTDLQWVTVTDYQTQTVTKWVPKYITVTV